MRKTDIKTESRDRQTDRKIGEVGRHKDRKEKQTDIKDRRTNG